MINLLQTQKYSRISVAGGVGKSPTNYASSKTKTEFTSNNVTSKPYSKETSESRTGSSNYVSNNTASKHSNNI